MKKYHAEKLAEQHHNESLPAAPHSCLIPYEELPEVEKAYDRDTAFGTLKLITRLGFKITKE